MTQLQHVQNGIAHFDIAGPDIKPLQTFYAATFGWTLHSKGPGFSLIETPEGSANGALVEAEVAALTIGIVVPNLTEALATAQNQGGTIAMPETDNGWVRKAQLRDPAGNLLTLIQG